MTKKEFVKKWEGRTVVCDPAEMLSDLESLNELLELKYALKQSTDLLTYAISFNDKRSLVDKLSGRNQIPESQKSSWQKQSEKSIHQSKELLK